MMRHAEILEDKTRKTPDQSGVLEHTALSSPQIRRVKNKSGRTQ